MSELEEAERTYTQLGILPVSMRCYGGCYAIGASQSAICMESMMEERRGRRKMKGAKRQGTSEGEVRNALADRMG